MLSYTKNQSELAAVFMCAAINAVVKFGGARVNKVMPEDGSGRKFIVTTIDYETPVAIWVDYYVEVRLDFTTHVNRIRSKIGSDGEWIQEGDRVKAITAKF